MNDYIDEPSTVDPLKIQYVKSLAQMKRLIATPGIEIHVLSHWQQCLVGSIRTPKTLRKNGKTGIQTNGYYFDGPHENYKTKAIETTELWAELPPASKLRFNDDGTVTFFPSEERSWTLRFVAGTPGTQTDGWVKVISHTS